MQMISIYTDGGSSPNPGPTSWAVVVVETITGKILAEYSGLLPYKGTNNQGELMAAVKALETPESRMAEKIIIHTDSNYIRSGITQWIKNWKRNGWRSSTGAVKNKDLWLILDEHNNDGREIEWQWVKGHSDNFYNVHADQLVNEARNGKSFTG